MLKVNEVVKLEGNNFKDAQETIDPLALNWRRFERVKLRATIQDYLDQWPATRAVYCNEKEGRA